MLPSETMIWQPEFTDKTLSRKPGAVQDCLVYAYAALRVSVQRWQLDLAVLAKSREEETTRPTLKELAAKLSGGVNGYSR